MQIHGATRLMALIGDPVAQARSPALVNEALARRGLAGQAVLVPLHVPAEGLAAVLHALRQTRNLAGAVVTMPHKSAAYTQIDEASADAQRAQAVNVIRREPDGRLVGGLLDGEGFVHGLLNAGHTVRGRHCVLAGAGGAASAIAHALAAHGCASLRMLNRTVDKAAALAQRLRAAHPALEVTVGLPDDAPVDVLVNGTSLGMRETDALPCTDRQIERASLVAECVLAPEQTALLRRAAELGRATHGGLHMLRSQIELMIDHMAPDLARAS